MDPTANTTSLPNVGTPPLIPPGASTPPRPPAGAPSPPARGGETYVPSGKELKTGKVGAPLPLTGPDLTRGWPYPAGQAFEIDGPLGYDGHGRTVSITPHRLVMDWTQDVPDRHDPGPGPRDGKLHMRFDIQVTNPDTGQATVLNTNLDAPDGAPAKIMKNDPNARIKQDPKSGRTRVDYVGADGKHSIEFDRKGTAWLDGYGHDVEPR